MKFKKEKIITIILYCVSFIIPILLTFIFFYREGYAPFGDNTLASMDAEIQYKDLFLYYKDVLNGNNNILYTFSKVLGGNCIAIWSYQLASPVNLLLLFFEKTQIIVFFHTAVAVKFGLASLAMFFYLSHRFVECFADNKNKIVSLMLAICYSFCQYDVAQCSNIHFLDGVYMLPFMAYGIYKLIQEDRGTFLSFSVGLMILFTWYTAGMNCIFSAVYFLTELAVYYYSEFHNLSITQVRRSVIWKKTKNYLIHMLLGVSLSSFSFLPTVISMCNASKSGLNLIGLLNPLFSGNVINSIEGLVIGAQSKLGFVALYSGSIVIVGLIAFFSNKSIDIIYRLIAAISCFAMLLTHYWKWMDRLFSLGKCINSFWYRHSYIAIFLLIATAAIGLFKVKKEDLKRVVIYTTVFIVVQYVLSLIGHKNNRSYLLLTDVFSVLNIGVICIFLNTKSRRVQTVALGMLLSMTIFNSYYELLYTKLSANGCGTEEYISRQESIIENIKKKDSSFYRISQINPRGIKGIRAQYNEGLAYNYHSITGYTSLPDEKPLIFLDKCGYRYNGEMMGIANTALLRVDSLLGVKYLLSERPLDGYDDTSMNGVFYNPYTLPAAFIPQGQTFESIEYYGNPFEYQNELFSKLVGKEVDIYTRLQHKKVSDHPVVYDVENKPGSYGNIPWSETYCGEIYADHQFVTEYSRWLSPSTFYIPSNEDSGEHAIEIVVNEPYNYSAVDEQFYSINFDALKGVKEILDKYQAKIDKWENGKVQMSVFSDNESYMFVSIPYDAGWEVKVNGIQVKTKLFEDCFYLVPVETGNNSIDFTYHCRGLVLGTILTILTIIALLFEIRFGKDASVGFNCIQTNALIFLKNTSSSRP